jgi:AcrR family transcriptional regulator
MPRGRRPGSPETRATILAVARDLFAEGGYTWTSMRAIADEAEVDVALVYHYFKDKDDLFLSALQPPVDPRELLAPVAAAGLPGAGEGILRVFLSVWDDHRHQDRLLSIVRGALVPGRQMFLADGFTDVVLTPLGVALGVDEPDRRMALVASQLIGLVVTRYLLGLPAIADASVETLVAVHAPVLQGYLERPLPPGP